MKRTEQLKQLDTQAEWDVVVIGGGASGLGIAVDAANRGYKTLLLEIDLIVRSSSFYSFFLLFYR